MHHNNEKEVTLETSTDTLAQENADGKTEDLLRLKAELKDAKERSAYLAADFENYLKRAEKERFAAIATINSDFLRELLPLVDDFDRAFSEIEKKPELLPYVTGFELIYKSLQKILAKNHVTEVSIAGAFNPEFHEAVMHIDDPSKQSGDIVSVFQKGYLFKGKLLRPAQVSVKP